MIGKIQKTILLSLFQLCLFMNVQAVENNQDTILSVQLRNISNPASQVYVSGQPTRQQLSLLKDLGIRHIVNLRPRAEQDWSEEAYVESLGMNYHNIPVEGAAGINLDNATNLEMFLAKHSGEPTLVHCASGNRVGALVALNEGDKHRDIDAAIATGNKWGLTQLEPVVREKLEKSIK